MWDNSLTYSLIQLIYQILFHSWDKIYWDEKINFSNYLNQLNQFDDRFKLTEISQENLEKYLEFYFKNEPRLSEILQGYCSEWSKTFYLVKAFLYTFLIEKEDLDLEFSYKKNIRKYLQLARELIGGQNVNFIHAVLAKICGEEIADFDK